MISAGQIKVQDARIPKSTQAPSAPPPPQSRGADETSYVTVPETIKTTPFQYETRERTLRSKRRVQKWIQKGEITIGIHGLYPDYKKPLLEMLDEIRKEAEENGIALPKLTFKEGWKPEDLDITVSHYYDSVYRKKLSKETDEGTLKFINGHSMLEIHHRLGVTFVLDDQGHADSFVKGYNNNSFKRVEVVFPYILAVKFSDGYYPPSFAEDAISSQCYDGEGSPITSKYGVEKVEWVAKAMMKHELYHALGIIGHNENPDRPSVLTASTFGRYRHFGPFERDALKKIYGEKPKR